MTADDLLRLYREGVRGELIREVLCRTMPTGNEHGVVVVNVASELRSFIKPRRLGRVAASDSGVWLKHDPDTVREPDVAYFSAQKIPLDERVTGYPDVVPDLVVEVACPGDTGREVNDKALMWLSYGVRLVWVVHPDSQTVDAHRPHAGVSTLTRTDTLHGYDVLPGFTCNISDIFTT